MEEKRKSVVVMVDPPEGWRYGFPAILEDDYEDQLKRAGYPVGEIETALKYSRYWEVEEVET